MVISIDVSPLQSGHKVRGVGFYLQHLKDALTAVNTKNTYSFFTHNKDIAKTTDLVHYPYFDPFFISLPLKKQYPFVVTVHDLTPLIFPEQFPSGLKGALKWQLNKGLIRQADAIITDSECSKRDIMSLLKIPKEKVHVVYLAAGEQFKPAKGLGVKELQDKYGLPEEFALYVGDVTWNKNLPRLVEAVKLADKPLVMVGKALTQKNYDKTHPWNKDLAKVQETMQGDPLFRTLGFVPDEDLVQLYNRASVFVMPSLYEGFGLPVVEAMSCGTPVITSKEGSLPEVAGDAAYYIDAKDEESIAEGIRSVMNDKDLQQSLREKGLEQVKKFSWKKTAEETIRVYESIGNI